MPATARPYLESMTVREAYDLVCLPFDELLAQPLDKTNYALLIIAREETLSRRGERERYYRSVSCGYAEIGKKRWGEDNL